MIDSKINQNDAGVWNAKGYALSDLGRYQEAITAYDKAIKINPNDAFAWNGKGNVLAKLGRKDEAKKAFEQYEKLRKDQSKKDLK